jgi:hypothetical protein
MMSGVNGIKKMLADVFSCNLPWHQLYNLIEFPICPRVAMLIWHRPLSTALRMLHMVCISVGAPPQTCASNSLLTTR